MYKISCGLVLLLASQPALATTLPGDTLSVGYLNAVQHWLFGRTAPANRALRQVAAGPTSPERESARQLLLDELYFWPGHYPEYLTLVDSMGFRTAHYEVAKRLANQPAPQYQLLNDSLRVAFRRGHGHAIITVSINGRPARLAIDTGAQRTFVSTRLAKRIGLSRVADVSVQNYFGQSVAASVGMVDSVRLGGLLIRDLPVLCADLYISGLDGLLGWDVLRQFALVIDYPNRRFSLRQSTPDSTLESNLLGGSRPMLLLHGTGNNQLNFFLDTGSSEKLRVSPTGLTKVGVYETGHKLSLGSAVGRFVRIKREKQVRKLMIGIDGKFYPFWRATLDETDEVIGQVIKDGLIGSGAFRRGRLTLDAPNRYFRYVE